MIKEYKNVYIFFIKNKVFFTINTISPKINLKKDINILQKLKTNIITLLINSNVFTREHFCSKNSRSMAKIL